MVQELRQRLDRLIEAHRLARSQVRQEKEALAKAEQDVDDCTQAQQLLQAAAEGVQNRVHGQVASVVTRCLKAVFGDDAYDFQIRFERKRGKTEARLLFVRDGEEMNPVDSAGGGVVDVAAIALRLACLMLARPRRRKFLALDEPAKHLSEEYRTALRSLLLALAGEMGVQFLVVSHSREFRIGKVVELT